jgi:DNA-binding CsgD family transcriptional regulator
MTSGASSRLDGAATTLELGQRLCELARESLGLSAFGFIDLTAPVRTLDAAVVWSAALPPERIWEGFVGSLDEATAAFGPMRELFDDPVGVHDLNAILGPRGLEQTRVYEVWRTFGAEREIMVTFGAAGRPRALVLLCRRAADPAFDAADLARIAALREDAARQLEALDGQLGARCAWLEALARGLPLAAALLDQHARLLWVSAEAAQRLDLRTSPLVGSVVVAGEGVHVLQRLARDVLSASHDGATDGRGRALPGMQAGERLAARRVELDGELAVLVWVVPAVAPGARLPAARDLERQGLSPREAEVALLAAEGYSIPGISGRLRIAENTVQTHLKRLYRKLGVSNRAQLAFRLFFAAGEQDGAPAAGRRRVRRRTARVA